MKKYISLALLFVSGQILSEYQQATSHKDLQGLIEPYPYALVCFGKSQEVDFEPSAEYKKEMKLEFHELEWEMRKAAKAENFSDYLNNEVGFFLLDLAQAKEAVVMKTYEIKNFPSCLVFKNGKRMKGASLRKTSTDRMVEYLKKKVGKQLDNIVNNKKAAEQGNLQERQIWHDTYEKAGHPYGYWALPWYGHGYSYGYYGPVDY